MTLRFGWQPDIHDKELGLVEHDRRLFVVEQRDDTRRVRVIGVVNFVAADAEMTDAIDRYIGNASRSDDST